MTNNFDPQKQEKLMPSIDTNEMAEKARQMYKLWVNLNPFRFKETSSRI